MHLDKFHRILISYVVFQGSVTLVHLQPAHPPLGLHAGSLLRDPRLRDRLHLPRGGGGGKRGPGYISPGGFQHQICQIFQAIFLNRRWPVSSE